MSDTENAEASHEDPAAGNGTGRVLDADKRKPLLIGLAVAVVAVALIWFLYETLIGSRTVSTDNAYVAADSAEVTPLTSGRVVELSVIDTQHVRKGQILIRLEDSDQKIAVARAEAMMAMAKRRYRQSEASISAQGASAAASESAIPAMEAKLASAQADLERAQVDYKRRAALVDDGAVSADEVTSVRNRLKAAQASVREMRASITQARAEAVSARRNEDASKALISGSTIETGPEVLAAKSELAAARLDLERTVIRSPIDGVVAQNSVQVGQKLDNGQVAMIVVPVDRLYVDANFKEDQLRRVRPGMSATLTSDLYGGDIVYHGKVVGFAGGTGSAFALIPAQNATGNWIKVVQRLPVRIELDPAELKRHPLRVGLSMEAEIDLTDAGD
ncbi:efflux transporter periplasmic adaptor subunit [Novosphingobium sp. PC22D]|uniref:HlyD family secretion protein n=1 Tax=Novosphingobium sp. PC22D TaxID=1962403 RepID=UPI000BF0E90B|nr:HlyD family secretion protein [Novosphingobium sp. PC22D]PEQ12798.1 efflux transporter periplasmic adaptor subunit [Novosphingobium sp. PC22D]